MGNDPVNRNEQLTQTTEETASCSKLMLTDKGRSRCWGGFWNMVS